MRRVVDWLVLTALLWAPLLVWALTESGWLTIATVAGIMVAWTGWVIGVVWQHTRED